MNSILVIEPDLVISRAMQKKFKDSELDCLIVNDVESAIGSIDFRKPDLIILELQLPVNNGIEFIYELKSYSDASDIPIIIYSYIERESMHLSARMITALGIVGVFNKSCFSISKLLEFTSDVLNDSVSKLKYV